MKPLLLAGIAAATVTSGCKASYGLSAEEVESALGQQLSARAGSAVTVDCPGDYLHGKVTCAISAPDGTHANVAIEAKPSDMKWTSDLENVAFGKQVADDIDKTFGDKYGLHADSISCPAIIVRGGDTHCQATVRSMTLPVDLSTSGETIGYSTDGGMIRGGNAQRVATELLAKSGGGTVSCDFDYRWAVPGETFTCQSSRGVVAFTIKDSKGNVDIALDTGPAGK